MAPNGPFYSGCHHHPVIFDLLIAPFDDPISSDTCLGLGIVLRDPGSLTRDQASLLVFHFHFAMHHTIQGHPRSQTRSRTSLVSAMHHRSMSKPSGTRSSLVFAMHHRIQSQRQTERSFCTEWVPANAPPWPRLGEGLLVPLGVQTVTREGHDPRVECHGWAVLLEWSNGLTPTATLDRQQAEDPTLCRTRLTYPKWQPL